MKLLLDTVSADTHSRRMIPDSLIPLEFLVVSVILAFGVQLFSCCFKRSAASNRITQHFVRLLIFGAQCLQALQDLSFALGYFAGSAVSV